jgi:hypothetical protein
VEKLNDTAEFLLSSSNVQSDLVPERSKESTKQRHKSVQTILEEESQDQNSSLIKQIESRVQKNVKVMNKVQTRKIENET